MKSFSGMHPFSYHHTLIPAVCRSCENPLPIIPSSFTGSVNASKHRAIYKRLPRNHARELFDIIYVNNRILKYAVARVQGYGQTQPKKSEHSQSLTISVKTQHYRLARSKTSVTTSQVLSISSRLSVGCTRNIRLVSPSSFATGNLSSGRQPVLSKAFSR